MDELLEMVCYLMFGLSVMLIAYFYHAKHVIRGISTKRVYLSKAQKRILLLSEWDQPSKLDVLFRTICITPIILFLIVLLIIGIIYSILYIYDIYYWILNLLLSFICFIASVYTLIALPLFYLIKFLTRKKCSILFRC